MCDRPSRTEWSVAMPLAALCPGRCQRDWSVPPPAAACCMKHNQVLRFSTLIKTKQQNQDTFINTMRNLVLFFLHSVYAQSSDSHRMRLNESYTEMWKAIIWSLRARLWTAERITNSSAPLSIKPRWNQKDFCYHANNRRQWHTLYSSNSFEGDYGKSERDSNIARQLHKTEVGFLAGCLILFCFFFSVSLQKKKKM